MKKNVLFAVVIIVVLVGGLSFWSLAAQSHASETSLLGQDPGYTLNLVIKDAWFNSTLGYQPAYFVLSNGTLESSANIILPAHEVIRVNIISYDTMISPPFFTSYANVSGTIENLMEITTGNSSLNSSFAPGMSRIASSVTYASITHTFSLSLPSGTINIPVEVGHNDTAFFEINQPGTYSWACMCPCGLGPMSTPGWMMGTVTAA